MRRHPTRAQAHVTAQHAENRVRLRVGTDLWTLTAGEAHDLADRLHDAAEALDRKDTP